MRVFIVILLSWGVSACSVTQEKAVKSPSITYAYKTYIKTSAEDCGKGCSKYVVRYPVFEGLREDVASEVQREIEMSFSMGDPEASSKTMAEVAEEFVASWNKYSKELGTTEAEWYYKGEAIVNVAEDTLLSIAIHEDYFTGGAHGGNGTYFINLRPKTGDPFTLNDFFKPGYQSSLTTLGEKAFRSARQLADTASFRYAGFEFPNGKFQLSNHYGFTNEGLLFYYNSYEIGAYALGPTEILVPYNDVKEWIR